jgi:Na+/melibiose symporter-like transporter
MAPRTTRILAVSAGVLIIWVVSVAVLTRVIPGPHQNVDYLVMGAVATFVSMIVLFVVLLQGWVKTDSVFYKRRAVAQEEKPAEPSSPEGTSS